jgi:hypothetical protein
MKRREREQSGSHGVNVADNIQHVMNIMHGHPFIRELVQRQKELPSVILYTDDQMKDLKKMSRHTGDFPPIIGVDRTFNVGQWYVTTLVYQHPHLVRRSNRTHPIFLGPVFLHCDGQYRTYHNFFSHLKAELEGDVAATVFGSDLVFGSDDEKALTKALRNSFPSATHTLCVRHVKDNISRYLDKKIGVTTQVKHRLLEAIFGNGGLLEETNEDLFDARSERLCQVLRDEVPTFGRYMTEKIQTIKEYVYVPRQSYRVRENWMNNNCESMNHVLKMRSNWKVLSLPVLIEELHAIVRLQYEDAMRALHGQGNFVLHGPAVRLRMADGAWQASSEEERKRAFQKFMNYVPKDKPRKSSTFVTSTDTKLTVVRKPTAKKPGQRTRIRASRTT